MTVNVPEDVRERCQAEADRSHGGDLTAVVHAALTTYCNLQDAAYVIEDAVPERDGESMEDRLARAAAAGGVSRSTLQGIAGTLTRVAGGPVGDLAAAPTLVKHYLDWVRADLVGHGVGCLVVSAQAAAGADGAQWSAPVAFARSLLQLQGTTLSGELDQWFSDRVAGPRADPFNPEKSDRLRVDVALDEFMGNATVDLVARSWGDARQSLGDLRVEEGVLVARGDSAGNTVPSAHYAIVLSSITIPG